MNKGGKVDELTIGVKLHYLFVNMNQFLYIAISTFNDYMKMYV